KAQRKAPPVAGLSLQEEPSKVTFTIDDWETSAADCTHDVMAITKMRFLQGTELGRAAPTRALPDGRAAPARRCSAQGRHLGSVMVTEELRAVCLPRVDEGRSVQAPSGVIPPPNPKIPRGMSEPRLGALPRNSCLGGVLARLGTARSSFPFPSSRAN